MLRAVRLLDGAPVPLLGVNLGVLGYLTEVEPPELTDALDRFVAGQRRRRVAPRRADDARRRRRSGVGAPLGTWRALNEAVVEKHESGHTVRLLARIDGEPFTTLRRRRADRRHTDRLDRVLAVGPRPGRVAHATGRCC